MCCRAREKASAQNTNSEAPRWEARSAEVTHPA